MNQPSSGHNHDDEAKLSPKKQRNIRNILMGGILAIIILWIAFVLVSASMNGGA